jgi:hypothetical protein
VGVTIVLFGGGFSDTHEIRNNDEHWKPLAGFSFTSQFVMVFCRHNISVRNF